MANLHCIKTNGQGVVVEYHDYEDVPEDFMPSADHVKLSAAPATDPVGRTHQPGQVPLFSDDYAPGFEPEDDDDATAD